MEDLPKPIPVNIEDEVRTSFLSYSMSVIISRALPDVRDGLKPVHRRVLYGMHEVGNTWNKAYKKSARIVGDVMGKYHPHGDSAIYDTLVRMAQSWNLRYPLVDGQGNFGSIDGDPPAAMRYSEVRMSQIADEMLADIDKDTVDFRPNFDETVEEPEVLPAKVPNLLINGAAGIAVGMATNIPPHNLREIIDATLHIIGQPDCSVADLLKICPAPDFPTGGLIYGYEGVRNAYETGRGAVTMRAKLDIEIGKNERQSIVVTELPYQVNKARVIEKIALLIASKKIDGISDIRDESARGNIRLVMDLKKDAVAQVIVNRLYKLTQLQDRFSIIMLAIVGGRPQVLNFKEMLVQFIQHRKEVVTRRTAFELRKAEARAHVLEGLKIAVDNIDEVVQLIKGAADPATAKTGLMAKFQLSEIQAQAILDMRLARLTGLERDKILAELEEIKKQIAYYRTVLADETLVYGIISEELNDIRERYGDDRRTEIVRKAEEIQEEDLIAEEDMVVTISHLGYIKRNPVTVYRAQRRGGRGKRGMTARAEDFVSDLFVASTHAYILIFTERGKLFWLKVHEIPQAGRTAKGKPIVNLVPIKQGDRIAAVVPVRDFTEDREILMATAQGLVKKTNLIEYSRVRPSGIIGISVRDGDRVVSARMVTSGKGQHALISTKNGLAIRFPEDQARSMGRSARGVKGINLREGDEVVSMDIIDREASILTMCENGFGKRTDTSEYPSQSRGGKGVITIKVDERNGSVVSAQLVDEDDDCMIVTDRGKVIRIKMKDVRVIGRNTKGVRLITMEDDERVVAASRLAEKEDDDGPADGSDDADGGDAEPTNGANGEATMSEDGEE